MEMVLDMCDFEEMAKTVAEECLSRLWPSDIDQIGKFGCWAGRSEVVAADLWDVQERHIVYKEHGVEYMAALERAFVSDWDTRLDD